MPGGDASRHMKPTEASAPRVGRVNEEGCSGFIRREQKQPSGVKR